MTTTTLGPATSWRLIHDGKTVLMLAELSGVTETIHNAFEAPTKHECMEQASQLGLTFLPEPVEQMPGADVAESISPRQLRQAMNRVPFGESTLRNAVEAVVAAGDQDLKDWWEFSTEVERSNTQVVAMGKALGLDDDAMDALWRGAAVL